MAQEETTATTEGAVAGPSSAEEPEEVEMWDNFQLVERKKKEGKVREYALNVIPTLDKSPINHTPRTIGDSLGVTFNKEQDYVSFKSMLE